MIEVARRRRPAERHHPHARKIVAVRRGGAQVADPAARAGIGVEAGDVGRGLLAAVGHGDVDACAHRRPASPRSYRPIAGIPIRGVDWEGRASRTSAPRGACPGCSSRGPRSRTSPRARPTRQAGCARSPPSGRRSGARPPSRCSEESPTCPSAPGEPGHLLGGMFPRRLDQPRCAPLGVSRTIVQIVCQNLRAVADDHLVPEHDRMKRQEPLGRSGGRRAPQIARMPKADGRFRARSSRSRLAIASSRRRSGPETIFESPERASKRRPPAVGLGRRGQVIVGQGHRARVCA